MDCPFKVQIFEADDVIVSKMGNKFYDTYYPGPLEIHILPQQMYKTWIVSRCDKNSNLTCNMMVPEGCAISFVENEPTTLLFGKAASTTYVNQKGKPIPTFWKFCFKKKDDLHKFYFMICGASGGLASEKCAQVATEVTRVASKKKIVATANKENQYRNMKKTVKTAKKYSITTTMSEGSKKEKNDPPKPKKRKLEIALPESSDESDVGDIPTPDSFVSIKNDDDDSPTFAESQDVFASMGKYHF